MVRAFEQMWMAVAESNRRVILAVAASLAAHIFLLGQKVPSADDGAEQARSALSTRLVDLSERMPSVTEPTPTRLVQARALVSAEKENAPEVKAVPPTPEVAASAAPMTALESSLAHSGRVADRQSQRDGPDSPDESAPVIAPNDGLNAYRIALALQARRLKRYPDLARNSGVAGRVETKLTVARDGQAQPATLVRSSGHEVLDRAALAMTDASAARVIVPQSLRGQAFAVILPIVFDLSD